MKIIELIKADIIKQRRSLLYVIVTVIPLGTTLAMFIDMYIRYHDYLYKLAQKRGINSWQMLLMENHGVLNWGMFLPVFVAVIAAVIHQTEFSQNSWKNLLSLPVYKSSVYFSKYITILFFSFIMIAMNSTGLIIVGKIIGFPEALDTALFIRYVLYQYAGILGVAAIHNWLSSYYKNLIMPVVVGFIGMIVSGIVLYQIPSLSKFFPYLYPFFSIGIKGYDPNTALYGGVISGSIALFMGIMEFGRRDII